MEIPKDVYGSAPGQRCDVQSKVYGKNKGEVDAKIRRYFTDYHPSGYSTRIVSRPTKHTKGYWHATIKRFSTCD